MSFLSLSLTLGEHSLVSQLKLILELAQSPSDENIEAMSRLVSTLVVLNQENADELFILLIGRISIQTQTKKHDAKIAQLASSILAKLNPLVSPRGTPSPFLGSRRSSISSSPMAGSAAACLERSATPPPGWVPPTPHSTPVKPRAATPQPRLHSQDDE